MLEEITIYTKPQNKYNLKGRFYSVYLTKNTNLDLSNIPQTKPNIESPNQKKQTSDPQINDFILKQQALLTNLENILIEQKKLLEKATSKLLTKRGDTNEH